MRQKLVRRWYTPALRFTLWGAAAVLICLIASSRTAEAANPSTIPFQGKVVNANGTNVTDGTYSFTFKLYSVSSGGTAIWGEVQSSVSVTSGVFQVNLGTTCSLFTTQTCSGFSNTAIDFNASPTLYLGMTFNSDPAGEMSPRIQLGSVPYAFNADKVGGFGASQLVQLTPGSTQSGSIAVTGTIFTQGSVQAATYDTPIAGSLLTLGGSNTSSITIAKSVTMPAGASFSVQSGSFTLGSSGNASTLVLRDGSATLGVIFGSASLLNDYTLNLPTTGASGTQCSQSTSGSITTLTTLQWGSCGVTAVGTFSGSSQANGATISSNTITFGPADGTNPGMVTASGTQTFAGAKIFSGNVTINGTNTLAVGTIFTADGTNSLVAIGSATADASEIDLVLDKATSYVDANTCGTNDYGSLYYNTATNAVRACISGAWEDLVSTAGLGILSFGVVIDSGSSGVGDAVSVTGAGVNGPCKVSFATTTTIKIQACVAYSGGRKVTVPATASLALSTAGGGAGMANNSFAYVCLNPATGVPQILASSTTETSATLPAWSINNPILCLAEVKAQPSNTLSNIWDTRVFSSSLKQFGTVNTAVALDMGLIQSTTTAGLSATTTSAATKGPRGVVGAFSGTASATAINAILVTNGPGFAKPGATTTLGASAGTTTTLGLIAAETTSTAGTIFGTIIKAPDSACSATTNCQYALILDLDRG